MRSEGGALMLCVGLALVVFVVGGVVFYMAFVEDKGDEVPGTGTYANDEDVYGRKIKQDDGASGMSPQQKGRPISEGARSPAQLGAVEDALCPSLLVPSGSEFVFVVKETVRPGRQEEAFDVVDMKGVALSRVVVSETGPHPGILLQTLRDKKPLCFVNTSRSFEADPKRRSLEICRPTGEVFGTMARDGAVGGRYAIWHARTRIKLLTFHGDFRDHAINVVNGQNQLICATEKCTVEFDTAPCVQVRVAPDVDAGLVMCGLFGIDKLELR